LALGAGAAATVAKDLTGSMLVEAAQKQRGYVKLEMRSRPMGRCWALDGGALVDVNAAAEAELATRAPARDGKAVSAGFCLTTLW
jgi:hypothetical protein